MIGAPLLPGMPEPDRAVYVTAHWHLFYDECGGAPSWDCYGRRQKLEAGIPVRIVRRSEDGCRALLRTIETLRPWWAWVDVNRLDLPQMELELCE